VPVGCGRYFARYLGSRKNNRRAVQAPKPVYEWLDLVHCAGMTRAVEAPAPMETYRDGAWHLDRPTRVWFAGTMDWKESPGHELGVGIGTLANRHRQELARRIGCDARRLPFPDYWQKLLSVSVAVSPWGLGEACWRDWDTLLAGCAVVKPACPWCLTSTGL